MFHISSVDTISKAQSQGSSDKQRGLTTAVHFLAGGPSNNSGQWKETFYCPSDLYLLNTLDKCWRDGFSFKTNLLGPYQTWRIFKKCVRIWQGELPGENLFSYGIFFSFTLERVFTFCLSFISRRVFNFKIREALISKWFTHTNVQQEAKVEWIKRQCLVNCDFHWMGVG